MDRSGESQPGAFFHLSDSDLVDPELIQRHEHLQSVQILGEQERPGGESSCLFKDDDFPVLGRELLTPVVLILFP